MLKGIGLPASCESALPYLEYAANTAAAHLEDLGYIPQYDPAHLDQEDVVMGEELIDYYVSLANDGDATAAGMLGKLIVVRLLLFACYLLLLSVAGALFGIPGHRTLLRMRLDSELGECQ